MATEDVGMAIKMNTKCFPEIVDLDQEKTIDETNLLSLVDFVNARYDCADFRMLVLIKTYKDYKKLLTDTTIQKIKEAILNFKYWMDEPGDDGMCFWSENHQLIFHTCEYLAGLIFPEAVFTNDGKTGKEHVEKAKIKIEHWLNDRFMYGMTEWHSNTYYEEDIAPLTLLIEQAKDQKIVVRAKMMLDLLLLDMALYSFEGYFVTSSGRAYEKQKKRGADADVNDILKKAFGILNHEYDYTRLSTLFLLTKNYQVPDVIHLIAQQREKGIIKASNGLNLSEVKHEIREKTNDRQGMYFWAMEAFTNPESIMMTMKIYNDWHLEENNFLRDLKMINAPVLRKLKLLPLLVKILNPATRGVAIERANTYVYHTKHYMLTTAQAYHPKDFGDQQHLWQASLPGDIHLFSTHPGSPMFDDPARNFSPSYWVGNGINPLVVQHENRVFILYNLTPRKGFLERKRQTFIHINLPFDVFDEVIEMEKTIFLMKKKTYCALQFSKVYEKKNDEVMVHGKHIQMVVTMGSSEQDGSFKEFIAKRETEELLMTRFGIYLEDIEHSYRIGWSIPLMIDKTYVPLEYPRLESNFAQIERKPKSIDIQFSGHGLTLDHDACTREVWTNERYRKDQ
ncbi:MAG: hypothetical protein C4537_01140 [Acholeplasma sp.]|jgi:hypothetical protein|nr:MAG: hypothetical protein C4537_01140 [Acholeplasma sp.]